MIINIKDIPENISGIYLLTYDNNKIYVGQAINIKQRALEHNSKNKEICDQALKIHNATIQILEEVKDITLLEEIEKLYIKKYQATNKVIGYNILEGGNASGKRGVENRNASLNQSQLNEVVDLLIYHPELSYSDIGNKFNVSQYTILKISLGKTYVNLELNYPLRRNNHESVKKDSYLDYFNSLNELLNLKEDLQYRWDLTIEEDLSKKYNIPLKILRDINNGRKFSEYGNYNYPIRTKNIRNKQNFSIDDIKEILNLLHTTKLSMEKIGKKYNIHRNTVAKINRGETYIIKNYNYPARN